MKLTLERYLQEEGLREELERRAHHARAEAMYRFLAQSAEALLAHHPKQEDACRSYASR